MIPSLPGIVATAAEHAAQPAAIRTAMPIDCLDTDFKSWPPNKSDLFLAPSTGYAKSFLAKQRFASVAKPSKEQSRRHAVATIPIVPKQPPLRSIRLL
jgi:hypothetical protein